jgi:YggT family protein
MNVIEKISFMTLSSILLIPLVSYSADSEAISALQIARPIFDIFVNLLSFLFICRTVISWYPKTDLNAFPYNIAAWPTEPLLAPVRDLVPPAFGVDVSSIVWVAVLSFLREILTGQQGILTLIEKNG